MTPQEDAVVGVSALQTWEGNAPSVAGEAQSDVIGPQICLLYVQGQK